ITLPSASYFQGRPPSATWVPPPVAVKNAGMPEPPARIRSASVPWGVSSTSSSPERYCRANSLFSPTYDEIIRRSRFSISSRPRPHSSTPQLLDTASRSLAPASSSASISTDGTPNRPKPPTANLDPAQAEPPARQPGPVRDVRHRLRGTRHDLVHARLLLRSAVILPRRAPAVRPGRQPPVGSSPDHIDAPTRRWRARPARHAAWSRPSGAGSAIHSLPSYQQSRLPR